VNDADQVIRISPLSDSMPESSRSGPAATMSPTPSVVKDAAE